MGKSQRDKGKRGRVARRDSQCAAAGCRMNQLAADYAPELDLEIWRDILGFGLYQASQMGRIRWSPDAPVPKHDHKARLGRVLRGSKDERGYAQVIVKREGKATTTKVARLIALAFMGRRQENEQINHINGVKSDNRVENLEYVTASENVRHAYAHGLVVIPKGKKNRHSGANRPRKLTEDNVLAIRGRLKTGEFARSIAPDYGVHETTINEIRRREIWAWV